MPPNYGHAANTPDRTIPAYHPVRRGRPRPSKVVSFEAPGDMAHILSLVAKHKGVSVSQVVRDILTVALETPSLWLDTNSSTCDE
jgi:hypothetical protein